MDYQPIDLTPHANSVDDLDAPGIEKWHGETLLRGLPFIFSEEGGQTLLLRLEPGTAITISLDATENPIRTITFAHRMRKGWDLEHIPGSSDDASYSFTLSGGELLSKVIRNGCEISEIPHPAGLFPSTALSDHSNSLPDREFGAFADAGFRLMETSMAGRWSDRPHGPADIRTPAFYLWSWINPRTEQNVVQINLESRTGVLEVGGICVGYLDEHPLHPERARIVVADLPSGYSGDGSDMEIRVDRGAVSYTRTLVKQPDPADPFSAWGDVRDSDLAGVYARVSATGSATVQLTTHGDVLEQARWAELRDCEPGHTRLLRVTESARNWVRTTIVDEATSEPIPCRINFSSPEGVPYQPYGHHHHVNSDLYMPIIDVGADVRLGRTTFAYVNGECEGWLPRGRVRVRITRGFEYQPVDDLVSIEENTDELTVRAKRLYDPAKEGWYSGDTHVHFVSSFGALKAAAAEGLSFVHLLQSQLGSRFASIEDFLGRPLVSDDGNTVLFTSQENRNHFLGHISLLGLKEPIMPWCTGGPHETEIEGAGLDTTLSDWADRCRAQGGTVLIAHFPQPLGEHAVLIATERADAIESIGLWQDIAYMHYYRYLNAGYRLPICGGTDNVSNDAPIGTVRTYVGLKDDDDFGYQSWCNALKSGRSYMTSGPLLDFSADGVQLGGTIRLPEQGGLVAVKASATSIFPMYRLELVHSGRVVASAEGGSGVHQLEIDENLRFDRPGWLCARVDGGGPEHLTQHRDDWQRAIMAHTSPIYVTCGERRIADRQALREMMALIEHGRAHVNSRLVTEAISHVKHHHGGDHREFLIRPFDQARLAIEERLRLGSQ